MEKVQCEACEAVINKEEWKPATVSKDLKFIGGCPTCHGEFYKELGRN